VSHTGRENLNISQHLLSIELIVDLFDKYKSYNVKGVIRMRKSKKNKQHNGRKKKVQKDKQRSTKHTHKTEDRLTRTPLEIESELSCSRRESNSCSKCDTRRVTLACKPCDKSRITKGSDCDYDEQNISVVISDTDTP
jgi:hypothetical protein